MTELYKKHLALVPQSRNMVHTDIRALHEIDKQTRDALIQKGVGNLLNPIDERISHKGGHLHVTQTPHPLIGFCTVKIRRVAHPHLGRSHH